MKILILDDQQIRHDLFDIRFLSKNYQTFHAYSVKQAVEFLMKDKFNYIYLDHDLGEDLTTGLSVALWLAHHMEHIDSRIIIHSFNYSGSANMASVLKRAGYCVIIDQFPAKHSGP